MEHLIIKTRYLDIKERNACIRISRRIEDFLSSLDSIQEADDYLPQFKKLYHENLRMHLLAKCSTPFSDMPDHFQTRMRYLNKNIYSEPCMIKPDIKDYKEEYQSLLEHIAEEMEEEL